jgi:DNA-binding GntR family transcriptional regulator
MPAGSRNSPYRFLPSLGRGKRGDTVRDVQNLLRDAIVRLELRPGVFIDKSALCARLGVSRFPVSEALGRLAAEGLVEVLPQRGTRVARVDLADCRQAMFIRRALEADAARAAAAAHDRTLLARLQQNLREQKRALKADDLARFHALDLALHEALLDALGFERVRATVEASRAILDRMRLFLCTPERQAATLAEHEEIVAALERHDENAAARAMELHLDAVMAELVSFALLHPEAVATDVRATAAA